MQTDNEMKMRIRIYKIFMKVVSVCACIDHINSLINGHELKSKLHKGQKGYF